MHVRARFMKFVIPPPEPEFFSNEYKELKMLTLLSFPMLILSFHINFYYFQYYFYYSQCYFSIHIQLPTNSKFPYSIKKRQLKPDGGSKKFGQHDCLVLGKNKIMLRGRRADLMVEAITHWSRIWWNCEWRRMEKEEERMKNKRKWEFWKIKGR